MSEPVASPRPAPASAPAPTPAGAPPPVAAPPQGNEASRQAAEKEQKERALQEKLDKRATVVAGVLSKFIIAFYAGRQQELEAARAAEAAMRASSGKKKGKKDKKKDEKGGGKDGGKPKKPPPTPVQQAWLTFLADMDDKINKQKRYFLEDLYRGVAMLTQRERAQLEAAVMTTTNKILPVDGMNINQINIKEAVAAGCAARGLSGASALPASAGLGLNALRDKGASAAQLNEYGYKAQDALRVGYTCPAVVHACTNSLPELRSAGVRPGELLMSPESRELATDLVQGLRGVTRLKQAGYAAQDLVSSGFDNTWTLARAGFSMQELRHAGVCDSEDLRAAGFGQPDQQPPDFLALGTLHTAVDNAGVLAHIPARLIGTQTEQWQTLLLTPSATSAPVTTAAVDSKAGMTRRQQAEAAVAAAADRAPKTPAA